MAGTRNLTPDMEHVIQLQFPNRTCVRPRYYLRRVGGEIGHVTLPSQPKTQNVVMMPAGGYSLTPIFGTSFTMLRNTYRDEVIMGGPTGGAAGGGGALLSATLKDGQPHYTDRSGDLTGVTPPTGAGTDQLPASGNLMMQRQVGALDSWNGDSLDATLAALGDGADLLDDINIVVPMISKKTFPENTGFVIRFGTPKTLNPFDQLIGLYMGGNTETLESGKQAGKWGLEVRGNGQYRVWEKVAGSTNDWSGANSFKAFQGDWTKNSTINSHVHVIGIVPYATERMVVNSQVSDQDIDATSAIATALSSMRQDMENAYVETAATTGHTHRGAMSGAGKTMLYMRSDYRHPFCISPVLYPITGIHVDAPFTIDRDLPANTIIKVSGNYHGIRDSHISVQLFEAQTNTPLSAAVLPNQFYSLAGVKSYYAVFTYYATTDRYASPILFSYDVTVDALLAQWNPTPIEFKATRIEITGPDQTPDHESASYSARDPQNKLQLLREQSRIWTNVQLRNKGSHTPITNIFRGEQTRPNSKRMGRKRNRGGSAGMNAPQVFPSEKWRDIEGRMLGAWVRIADQKNVGRYDFRIDPYGAKDAQGKPLPWKITDIIRQLLYDAGFDNTQAFIQDLPFRLWYGPNIDNTLYSLTPGAGYLDAILKLTKEILGLYLVYDPNVSTGGGDGAWILLSNPNPLGTPLWEFETERPTTITSPKLMSAYQSYGVNKIWIEDGSFFQDVQAPEFNFISVSSVGQLVPGQGGMRMRYTNFLQNYSSINGPSILLDGSRNPDFLGRVVPIHIVDPYLGGAGSPQQCQAAVDLFTFRIYDFAAHAKLWCRFTTGLRTGFDGNPIQTLSRAPRINDLCTINGYKAVIRSCNPHANHDSMWKMNIQAVFLNNIGAQ